MSDESKRTFIEEVEINAKDLVERVQDLLKDSNAKRLTIRNQEGKELMTIPLTFGVVAGGVIAVTTPLLAALGALAALVTKVKLEVTRDIEEQVEEQKEPVAT